MRRRAQQRMRIPQRLGRQEFLEAGALCVPELLAGTNV